MNDRYETLQIVQAMKAFSERMTELLKQMESLTANEKTYVAYKFHEIEQEYIIGCRFIISLYPLAKDGDKESKTFRGF